MSGAPLPRAIDRTSSDGRSLFQSLHDWPTRTAHADEQSALSRSLREVFRSAHTALFALDSAELNTAARKVIQRFAEIIRRRPNARITIEGATDYLGPAEHGIRLGLARARAVAEALFAAGVPKAQIERVRSLGESRPIAGCRQVRPDGSDNPDCRALNRRVIITLSDR